MTADMLAEIAEANRPEQFTIMDTATGLLSASPAVSHLMVRGSFADGTSDRLSDIDLVVGVREPDYPDFTASQDALIRAAFCQMLPGWLDTIVPPFGGAGWVHLIQHQGTLYQLDLYVAPSGRIHEIQARTRGRIIYTTPQAGEPDASDAERAESFARSMLDAQPTAASLITELLVLAHMIHKRLARGQRFMAYKEAYQFTDAARGLARTGLAPRTEYLRWYHLEETLGETPLGKECLALLRELTDLPAVPDGTTLPRMLDIVLRLAALAGPDALTELQPGIDACLSLI